MEADDFLKYVKAELNSFCFDTSEQISHIHLCKCQTLVKSAICHSPFYSKFYAGRHLPKTLEEFQQLPILSKEMIQQNMERIVCKEFSNESYTASSSGSTGRPVTVLRTYNQRMFEALDMVHEMALHGCDLNKKYAIIRAGVEKNDSDHWTFVPRFFKTGHCFVLNSNTPVEQQLLFLNEYQPSYLLTHPSNLMELDKYSSKPGNKYLKPTSLEFVRTIGEPVTDSMRKTIRKSLGIEIVDLYSSRECGRIAFQCPETNNLHVQEDTIYLEVINDNGEQCQPGEIGRVVVTVLNSFAFPLIRYANGDYAEVGERCSCGSHWKTLKRVIGRERNMITLPDGSRHWPSFPSEEWLAINPDIKQFRLVQHELNTIEVQIVVPEEHRTIDLEIKISSMLNRRFGADFWYSFTYLDEIRPGKNGKFEDFISHVK